MHRFTIAAAIGLLLLSTFSGVSVAQEPSLILAFGDTGFLEPAAVQAATGARVVGEMGGRPLQDFSVVILADEDCAALPGEVREGLGAYVAAGGTLLITGGPHSWGAGECQSLASILPFRILGDRDWGAVPFRETVPVEPGHPILAGVEFPTIGSVNWVEVAPGASEILRLAGGPHSYPASLIAEKKSGAGDVLGMTFDPNRLSGMAGRSLFVRNVITYLLTASGVG